MIANDDRFRRRFWEGHMHTPNHAERYEPLQVKRETTRQLWRTMAISAGFVLLSFVLLLGLFWATRWLPGTGGSAPDWGLLEGFTSLIALCLLVGGFAFTFQEIHRNAEQYRRERAQASYAIYKEMYDKLTDPEAAAARRWVLQTLPTLEEAGGDREAWLARSQALLDERPEGQPDARPAGRTYLKQILNCFDFIGFVATHYWTIENELVIWMNPVVAKVWERVYHVVEDEAERRGEPDFYRAARDLGEQCVRWRRERGWRSAIIEDAT
jgi:hypothetical protein